MNAVKMVLAVLFDKALDKYHNKHSPTNFSAVGDNESLSLREDRLAGTANDEVACPLAIGKEPEKDSLEECIERTNVG